MCLRNGKNNIIPNTFIKISDRKKMVLENTNFSVGSSKIPIKWQKNVKETPKLLKQSFMNKHLFKTYDKDSTTKSVDADLVSLSTQKAVNYCFKAFHF